MEMVERFFIIIIRESLFFLVLEYSIIKEM